MRTHIAAHCRSYTFYKMLQRRHFYATYKVVKATTTTRLSLYVSCVAAPPAAPAVFASSSSCAFSACVSSINLAHFPRTFSIAGTSFFNVALHELGHSLGLGHSSDPNAVMRPWYESNEVDKLPDDDRNAIQELYGSKDKIWAPYRPHIPPPTTTTTTTMRPRVYYPQTRPNNYPSYTPNYYPNRDRTREDEERERERQRQIEQERERQRQIEKTERDRIHRLKLEERERQERERERIKRLREERERQEYLRREYERQQRERAEREREREEREREREEHERGRERERTRATPPTHPARRIPATQPSYRTYNNPSQRTNKPYKPRKTKPDSCTTSYDAISMLRGELFIFKGQVSGLEDTLILLLTSSLLIPPFSSFGALAQAVCIMDIRRIPACIGPPCKRTSIAWMRSMRISGITYTSS